MKDLEITVLGDVIAILKHAKTVQNKRTTEKVLKTEKDTTNSQTSSSERRVVVTKQSDHPAKKLVNSTKIPSANQPPAKPTVSSRLGPPKPRW